MRPRSARAALVLAAALLLGADATELNGFKIANPTVPRSLLVAGGPARDRIQAVDEPTLLSPDEARDRIVPDVVVIGLVVGEEARAYPLHLLEYHQVVNDVVGGTPVAVTYDPLAGAPLAFRREVDGRTLRFGVSGLLYNANFLFYDRETESLWSQLLGAAVSGPLAGKKLAPLRVRQETLFQWFERFPKSQVMAAPDPKRINYRFNPYSKYMIEDRIPFAVAAKDERFHAKRLVFGVVAGGKTRAYLDSRVMEAGGTVEDEIAGKKIHLEFRPGDAVFVYDVPEDVSVTEAYWFAWKAFHPDTEVWGGDAPQAE